MAKSADQLIIARAALQKAKELIDSALLFRSSTETETWKNHAQEWLYDLPRILGELYWPPRHGEKQTREAGSRSDEWLRRLGAQDAIMENVLALIEEQRRA